MMAGKGWAMIRTAMLALALCAAAFGARAADYRDYAEFRDWRVSIHGFYTEDGEFRVKCRAFTGGDGAPVLALEVSNGDALPPYHWPEVRLEETAPRGYATHLVAGPPVSFIFDDGVGYPGQAWTGRNEEGFAAASAAPDQAFSLNILQGMRRGRALYIQQNGRLAMMASLSGFTAAYGRIAEACGFTTAGVIR